MKNSIFLVPNTFRALVVLVIIFGISVFIWGPENKMVDIFCIILTYSFITLLNLLIVANFVIIKLLKNEGIEIKKANKKKKLLYFIFVFLITMIGLYSSIIAVGYLIDIHYSFYNEKFNFNVSLWQFIFSITIFPVSVLGQQIGKKMCEQHI